MLSTLRLRQEGEPMSFVELAVGMCVGLVLFPVIYGIPHAPRATLPSRECDSGRMVGSSSGASGFVIRCSLSDRLQWHHAVLTDNEAPGNGYSKWALQRNCPAALIEPAGEKFGHIGGWPQEPVKQ
jgi:hypothetical protein